MKVLVTGSEGFIGGYIVKELINKGYEVVGIDNLSKYGKLVRSFSEDKNYRFLENHKVKRIETLAFLFLTAIVIKNGMNILGVSLPEKM